MRRLSSSSWLSRPVTPMDNTASETMMAMITITTKISTSVKPLLRMLGHRRAPRLFRVESRGTDVRVVTFTARLAVAAIGSDVILAAIGPRTGVYVDVVPRILGKRLQIPIGVVIGERRIRRLLHQSLQALFGRGVFEVVEPVQVEGGLNGPNVALCPLDLRHVDFIYDLRHHHRAQH